MDAPDLALDSMEAEELELTRTPGSSPAWLTRTTSSSRFVAMETGSARVLVAANGVGPESEALVTEDIGQESEEVAAEDVVDPLLSTDDSDPMVLAADGMVSDSHEPTQCHAKPYKNCGDKERKKQRLPGVEPWTSGGLGPWSLANRATIDCCTRSNLSCI